jgi:hypothetical protein
MDQELKITQPGRIGKEVPDGNATDETLYDPHFAILARDSIVGLFRNPPCLKPQAVGGIQTS